MRQILFKAGFHLLVALVVLQCNFPAVAAQNISRSQAQSFIHPGVLHNKNDMERMYQMVKNQTEPAYSAFLLLKNHALAQPDYIPNGPFRVISRDGEFRNTKSAMEADFSAAYLNALMWICTRNETHAQKALDILTAYADTLRLIPETNDAPLLAGLEGFKIIYTLEALKYTYEGATDEKLSHISKMVKDIFIPVMENFYARPPYTNGNWGPIVTKAYMVAAIWFNNRAMYQKAVNFYLYAHDNGTISNYIDGETGQIQESGRDQSHCMLGIGAMATICELAYKQGDDLYAALDNRLLKGYEYVAKYNLGHDVPFRQWTDVTGKYNDWPVISDKARGRYMPVFEIACNHYVQRMGLQMPYTLQALEKIRPEGYDRDQPGFGALLFHHSNEILITSPDKNYTMRVYGKNDQIFYSVNYKGKSVIDESQLGINGNGEWKDGIRIENFTVSQTDTTWKPVYGERSIVTDKYREYMMNVARTANFRQRLQLIVRAYNEGIAFRYRFAGDEYLHIANEYTEYVMPEGTMAYFTRRAQAVYHLLPLKEWPDECERPLALELPNGLYALLTEAEMVDYVRTRFVLSKEKPNAIVGSMYGAVDHIAPYETPWRVIMAAEKPGMLIENNDLLLNLNKPCEIEDTQWIRPGKVMREVTLSTEGGKALVDFAVKRNLQYIHFDAGWYGPEGSKASDATTVTLDPARNKNPDALNLQEVVAYATQHGIGVMLYVNQRALHQQLDDILPLYKSWGIAGIKFGFVMVGSQYWTTWMHDAVKKCAQYGLMVDIHDEYRPTGFSRTYPNLMTQEGVYGNEEFPDATNNVTLPFTRFTQGAADYTICYYRRQWNMDTQSDTGFGLVNARLLRTTPAHQLAMAVVYYSPLQFLYWYDRPHESQNEPELEFFDRVPVVWDDTRVIHGEIGKYITIARRSGDDWFVGSMTNNDARKLNIPLNFLPEGKTFTAHIYHDDPTVRTRTKVGIKKIKVTGKSVITADMPASGGHAIWIQSN